MFSVEEGIEGNLTNDTSMLPPPAFAIEFECNLYFLVVLLLLLLLLLLNSCDSWFSIARKVITIKPVSVGRNCGRLVVCDNAYNSDCNNCNGVWL